MVMYKPGPNTDAIHLSFYTDEGKLVTEHIPKEHGAISRYLRDKYLTLLVRRNWPIYYWDLRFLLPPIDRKAEDLRLIDHVITVHDGKPITFREKRMFMKALRLYGNEYSRLARHIFQLEREKEPVMHPYVKAYIKMWQLDREPQWKVLYHGIDRTEYIDILELMMRDEKKKIQNGIRKIKYQKKKLNKA